MNCDLYRFLCSARLDGVLDAEESLALEAHLATCVECREHLRELQGVRGLLRAEPSEPPPDGTGRELFRRIEMSRRSPVERAGRRLWSLAPRGTLGGPALTLALLGLLLGFLAVRPRAVSEPVGEVLALPPDVASTVLTVWDSHAETIVAAVNAGLSEEEMRAAAPAARVAEGPDPEPEGSRYRVRMFLYERIIVRG